MVAREHKLLVADLERLADGPYLSVCMAVRRTRSGIQRRKPSLRDFYSHIRRALERVSPASILRRRDRGAGRAYRALDVHVDKPVA